VVVQAAGLMPATAEAARAVDRVEVHLSHLVKMVHLAVVEQLLQLQQAVVRDRREQTAVLDLLQQQLH
jgi:hypothetical protein